MRATLNFAAVLFCCAMSATVAAQNLVPNPGFEVYTACPKTLSDFPLAHPWYWASGSPDFFHACSNGQGGTTPSVVGVPENFMGHQAPRTGNGYGGFYLFNTPDPANPRKKREYMGIKLLDTLKKEVQYLVEFYLVLADSSNYALASAGAYFSTSQIVNIGVGYLSNTPQVVNSKVNPLTSRNGWTRVSGTFVADGGEQFMTIGNFNTDQKSDTSFVPGINRVFPYSYYYIDDISVTAVNSPPTGIAGATTTAQVEVYPNPIRDKAVLQFSNPGNLSYSLRVYDMSGRQVRLIEDITTGSVEMPRGELSAGLYFFRLQGAEGLVATGKLVLE